ncbi:MAG: CcmD family protein [Proteobacteria bacterium]|nr:CcmD family protein [Pseudomonadota bacterium]
MPNTYEHLFWGYFAIWTFLALVVFSVIKGQRKLKQELEMLKQKTNA